MSEDMLRVLSVRKGVKARLEVDGGGEGKEIEFTVPHAIAYDLAANITRACIRSEEGDYDE
ncbi:hypothetical protein [Streptomyces griseus]|uniref:hypothetical protein n=1 Tax=Streptomyces griseus TaxID=1911 RepID=UPI0033F7432B